MRHFKTKRQARAWRDKNAPSFKIFKKVKGQRNRIQKPYVVGTEFQFLNLY